MGACKSTQFCCCIALDHDESVILDKPTGKEIRHGAGWFCFPNWWNASVIKAKALQNNQYIVVKHNVDLEKNNTRNEPLKSRLTTSEKFELLGDSDVQLLEIIRGPQIYKAGSPYDTISEIKTMINLLPTQFIIVTDKLTGMKRVECGPQLFCPKPYDEIGAINNMYNLTSTQYVIVTDLLSGEKATVIGKNQADKIN